MKKILLFVGLLIFSMNIFSQTVKVNKKVTTYHSSANKLKKINNHKKSNITCIHSGISNSKKLNPVNSYSYMKINKRYLSTSNKKK
jgi:hypothetical protein